VNLRVRYVERDAQKVVEEVDFSSENDEFLRFLL
jgi:hypothetical protein